MHSSVIACTICIIGALNNVVEIGEGCSSSKTQNSLQQQQLVSFFTITAFAVILVGCFWKAGLLHLQASTFSTPFASSTSASSAGEPSEEERNSVRPGADSRWGRKVRRGRSSLVWAADSLAGHEASPIFLHRASLVKSEPTTNDGLRQIPPASNVLT